MVMAIPMVLAATTIVRSRWMKGLSLVVAAVALTAELVAYTRAGWLGLAGEGLAGGWLSGRRWLLVGLILAFAAIGFGFVVASEMGFQRDTTDPWTLGARVAVWKLAVADLWHHPLVGIGYGNNNFVKRYAGQPELEKAYGPHSTFVVVGLGSGLPALLFFGWLLLRIFLTLTRRIGYNRSHSNVAFRAVPFGAALMVVGFTVRNLFDYMFIGSLANLFWILVATALFCVQDHDRIEDLQPIHQHPPVSLRA
jgi:heptosyltransferase-3/putative inorganic carbon (HCO3(-)) transporter